MRSNSPPESQTPTKPLQFRLRGNEMNRIEAVSDVVFGFALTLLVVSLEVPHTYADLVNAMRGFPAFALTFALLMALWARHYYFFSLLWARRPRHHRSQHPASVRGALLCLSAEISLQYLAFPANWNADVDQQSAGRDAPGDGIR
jgi:hypothetical protein